MIYDAIDMLCIYGTRFAKAAEFLAGCAPDTPVGRYEIDGEDMFALVQSYRTKPEEEGAVEAHMRYIDIQVCLTGRERIDYFHVPELSVKTVDQSKDVIFFRCPSPGGNSLELVPGRAAVFHPHDAHKPGLHPASGPADVIKAVVKVAADSLSLPLR